jgi:hypothetical protein
MAVCKEPLRCKVQVHQAYRGSGLSGSLNGITRQNKCLRLEPEVRCISLSYDLPLSVQWRQGQTPLKQNKSWKREMNTARKTTRKGRIDRVRSQDIRQQCEIQPERGKDEETHTRM